MAAPSRASMEEFVGQEKLALVGVQRSGQGFGQVILEDLRRRGHTVWPVHPVLKEAKGEPVYPSLAALPGPVGGVVVVVPPEQSALVVREAKAAGIPRVWLQQGAESEEVIAWCEANGLSVIHGQCILMFAEPVGFPHNTHRWMKGLFHRLPR